MSIIPDAPVPPLIDEFLTVDEFARRWRVEASVVRSWIKNGYIRYTLIGPNKMRRIRKSDVVKPLEAPDVTV